MQPALKVLIVTVQLAGISASSGQDVASGPPAPSLKDIPAYHIECLGNYPEDPLYTTASPDGNHVAVVANSGSRQAVWLDGVRQTLYDEIVLRLVTDSNPQGVAALQFSSDSTRLIYIARRGSRYFVVVDGKEERPYLKISALSIAPAGNGYAYIADTRSSGEGARVVVWNGAPGDLYAFIPDQLLRFSPDGKRFGYMAQDIRGGALLKNVLVIDGKIQPYPLDISHALGKDYIQLFQFSADSAHLAAVASVRDREQLIVDGVAGPTYDSVQWNSITRDGKRSAYIGWRKPDPSEFEKVTGLRWSEATDVEKEIFKQTPLQRAVVDNREQGGFFVTALYLHPISGRFAYINKPNGRTSALEGVEVWVDGKRGPEYRSCLGVFFSPDGKRIAYLASTDNRRYAVVDDRELGPFESLDEKSFQFSPDGSHYGFIAKPLNQPVAMIIDGGYVPGLYQVSSLTFSPNGKRYAYIADAEFGRKPLLVVDGRKQELPAAAQEGSLIFSPDSTRVACLVAAHGSDATRAMVDDAIISPLRYQYAVRSLGFSPDGQHYVFTATVDDPDDPRRRLNGSSNWFKQVRVVDGRPGPMVQLDLGARDQRGLLSPTVWAANGDLRYFARDDEGRLLSLELASANLSSLPSIKDLEAGVEQELERAAKARAQEETRAKAAQAQAEAEQRARNPFQLLRNADTTSPDPAFVVLGTDGELYGARVAGRFATGTLFRMHPDGSNFEVLHSFEGPEERLAVTSLIVAKDGTLYGSAAPKFQLNPKPIEQAGSELFTATLFKFVPATREYSVLYAARNRRDGWRDVLMQPLVSVATEDGTLYGKCDPRMVFRFSTKDRVLDVIVDATWTISQIRKDDAQTVMLYGRDQNGQTTRNPKEFQILGDKLLLAGNRLYSAVEKGGKGDVGMIVSIGLNGEDYRTIYDFSMQQSPEGHNPCSTLILGQDHALYGICTEGGNQGQGAIFSIDLNGNKCRPVLTFSHEIYAGHLLVSDDQGWLYFWIEQQSSDLQLFRVRYDGSRAAAIYLHKTDYSGASPLSLAFGRDDKLFGTLGANVFSFRVTGEEAPGDLKPKSQASQEGQAPMQAAQGTIALDNRPVTNPDQVQVPERTLNQESGEGEPPATQRRIEAEGQRSTTVTKTGLSRDEESPNGFNPKFSNQNGAPGVESGLDQSNPSAPTQPDLSVSVREFVQSFWKHHVSNDPNDWASDFASRANYCYSSGGQWAGQHFIGHDRAKLVQRYPVRHYEFSGLTVDMQPGRNCANVGYAFNYSYAGVKSASGTCRVSLTVQQISGRWLITAYDETVGRR
jgi:hypothetical protein